MTVSLRRRLANLLKKELHRCPEAKREGMVSSRQRSQHEQRHGGGIQEKGMWREKGEQR